MAVVLAVVTGALYGLAVYLMLRRSVVKLVLGLALLAHGANLLIFTAGRLVRAVPPIVPPGGVAPPIPSADPLPQALILTAIVIGFGVQAFALVLLKRAYGAVGSDDLDQMSSTEGPA